MGNEIELLDESRAAALLTVEVGTLRNWRVSGRGPRFVRIGRLCRYRPQDLLAFVESGLRQSTTDHGMAGTYSTRTRAAREN